MFKTPIAVVCAVLISGFGSSTVAQTAGSTVSMDGGRATSEQATDRPGARTGEEQQRGRNRQRTRPAPPADPAVIMAEAQAVLTALGNACTPTEASLMGLDAQQQKVYEVACAAGTGPGYIIVTKVAPAPAELLDCVLLAGQAERARATNPAAVVDVCKLAGNQNPLAIITNYAQAAGIACTVDQGMAIGRNAAGVDVYEVGCNAADGYWIEKTGDGGWDTTECTIIVSQGATCRFTTPAEIAGSFKTRLAGTAADDCDVTQVRYMGANNNGAFYEAKCAAEGTGYIARTNTSGAVQQVYACATAQRIGGGCTLTTVAPPAAANEE